jgi:3-oxoacyl-[acyl-carrier protein] reductase
MNTYDLNGKTAVITGGAQGIGLAVAERFAASGAKIASWDMLDDMNGAAMDSLDTETAALHCDISSWDSVSAAMAETEAKLGGVDILVNSAGIAGSNAPVQDYDVKEFAQIIDINLNGTFYTNRVVLPGMIERNYGRIINLASVAGKDGNPNASAYSASKAGVIGFTKSLGKEVADKDIAVCCVTPAGAKTAIFDQMTEKHVAYMLSKVPRGRFLEVDEAASMITWIATAENSFTTAAVFDLSGGRSTY